MIDLRTALLSAAASLALVACASANEDAAVTPSAAESSTAAQAAPTQTNPAPAAAPAPAAQTGAYTDAQLTAFLAANQELTPTIEAQRANLQGTPEQQAQAQAAIAAAAAPIFQRHGIDGATYNAIIAQARDDVALRQRLGALQAAAPASSEGD